MRHVLIKRVLRVAFVACAPWERPFATTRAPSSAADGCAGREGAVAWRAEPLLRYGGRRVRPVHQIVVGHRRFMDSSRYRGFLPPSH